jgi:hypothetical protein
MWRPRRSGLRPGQEWSEKLEAVLPVLVRTTGTGVLFMITDHVPKTESRDIQATGQSASHAPGEVWRVSRSPQAAPQHRGAVVLTTRYRPELATPPVGDRDRTGHHAS